MHFVDLKRRFHELTDAEQEDTELLVALSAYEFGPAIGWPELLEHARVIVLAEAGAGKTREMEEQAKHLEKEGRFAFFVPLEDLDRESIANVLSPLDEKRLEAWKADGRALSWFFLDAVDELKLTGGKLDRALRRFSTAIDGHNHRARVIISCRPSDWRSSSDLSTVKQRLPVVVEPGDTFVEALRHDQDRKPRSGQAKAEPSDPDRVRVVFMVPMNDRQIQVFAEQSGLADANAFLQEIQQQNARAFAGRPLDLAELIVTWKSLGRLGTRKEQHETNVTARLKDDPDRPDHGVITDVKARTGAERLALALALTRTRSIRSPEQTLDTHRADGVLDAAEILPDWTEAERQALLRRALFDPATYGRVRFHHRSVQEYLAAWHLQALRGEGMSTKALFHLLFAEQYGVDVVFPSMRAIAAWLALSDGSVRKKLAEREPEAFLSLGDPETLDIAARSDFLRAFVSRYGQGSWRGFNFDNSQLRRLAHPDLAPTIRECWGDGPVNDDVRDLLVRMIWLGPVPDCADLAVSVAFDPTWSVDDRIVAIRALVTFGWTDSVREVADGMLAQSESWPHEIVHGVAADLFPTVITVDELVTLMERTPEPENNGVGFEWTSLEIAEDVDPQCETAVSLRDQLADLIWRGRGQEQEFYHIHGRYDHLAPALAVLCERQLSAAQNRQDAELIRSCAIASRFCGEDFNGRGPVGKLRKHLNLHGTRRADAFWAELAFMDEVVTAEDDWHRYYHAKHGGLVGCLTEDDGPWLSQALADEGCPERRTVALHALIEGWHERGRVRSELDAIRANLKGDEKLGRTLEERTARRRPSKKIKEFQRKHDRYERTWNRKEARRLEDWKKWRHELLADPADAFSPEKRMGAMANIYSWLQAYKQGSNSLNIWDKDALTQAFGEDVANRAELAFQAYWPTTSSELSATRPASARKNMTRQQLHGFLGVSAESMRYGWTNALSPEEARTAVVYATLDLGGFAPFINDLAKSHPAEVGEVIGGEVSAEINVGGDQTHLPVLQQLTHADSHLKQLFIPRLLDELKSWPSTFTDETGPRWAQHVDQVLHILNEARVVTDRESIAQECIKRYEADPTSPVALIWLKGLFRFDALTGTRLLTEALADSDDTRTRTRAVEIFATLFGDHDPIALEIADPGQCAEVLGKLVRYTHMFVRPKDDRVHHGAHTSDARGHAEHARRLLFSRLLDTPGPEARRVVLDLAEGGDFVDLRDYLRLRARKRTAEDAEAPPYAPADVFKLEERHEAPPKDSHGLFAVMMDRLANLQYDLDHHDFTDRRTVQGIQQEPEMQRTLALRLEGQANGAYFVTREEEVADQKHTDIRLSCVGRDQRAVVEVKIADKWTLQQLGHALQNQLEGQYLRHSKCKAGCLLLTYHGRKNYWIRPDSKKRLQFAEVVEYLKEKVRILANMPDVRVTAVGLDLTAPDSRP